MKGPKYRFPTQYSFNAVPSSQVKMTFTRTVANKLIRTVDTADRAYGPRANEPQRPRTGSKEHQLGLFFFKGNKPFPSKTGMQIDINPEPQNKKDVC